jgi:hypothetical protein
MILAPQKDQLSTCVKFQIKTFTGRYIPIEDRLWLDAVDGDGNNQSIFMTRRLTDKMLPVMVEHLEAQTPEGMPSDLVQEMQQDKSRLVRAEAGSETSVEIDPEVVPWLCKTVHLTKTGTGLVIIFTDDNSIEASMPMSNDNLRVVLDIFQTLYTSAEWGQEVFPDWMQAPQDNEVPRQLN